MKSERIRVLNIYDSISEPNLSDFHECRIGILTNIINDLYIGVLTIFLIFLGNLEINVVAVARIETKKFLSFDRSANKIILDFHLSSSL